MPTELRPDLERVRDQLLTRDERVLALDTIAEALGTLRVDHAEIDALFSALEENGCTVGDPDAKTASSVLGPVLATARQLKAELGRAPSVSEIAARAQLSVESVRLGLLFAQIAQR